MIFVTEPFSESRRVKVDDATRDPRDTFDALKLNLVRDFQTGIYDYDTMLSLFVRSADLTPAKVSFSSTEWCGNVYEEMRVDPAGVRQRVFSYFEGESGERTLSRPRGGLLEDELYVWVRGLRREPLPAGGRRSVPLLPGAFARRLAHEPAAWTTAIVERAARPERIRSSAGHFLCIPYVVRVADGREGRFWVESAYPHRIVRWSWKPGARGGRRVGIEEQGELLGSARLAYWKLHGNGEESYLRSVGLGPGIARMR